MGLSTNAGSIPGGGSEHGRRPRRPGKEDAGDGSAGEAAEEHLLGGLEVGAGGEDVVEEAQGARGWSGEGFVDLVEGGEHGGGGAAGAGMDG